mmetsp:Transcript_46627/g.89048  ORF Transcript_46627/g.89048 Transcript_46627/m.89048 type:complete len:263 (+) Transcript_46627:5385-6173(+)
MSQRPVPATSTTDCLFGTPTVETCNTVSSGIAGRSLPSSSRAWTKKLTAGSPTEASPVTKIGTSPPGTPPRLKTMLVIAADAEYTFTPSTSMGLLSATRDVSPICKSPPGDLMNTVTSKAEISGNSLGAVYDTPYTPPFRYLCLCSILVSSDPPTLKVTSNCCSLGRSAGMGFAYTSLRKTEKDACVPAYTDTSPTPATLDVVALTSGLPVTLVKYCCCVSGFKNGNPFSISLMRKIPAFEVEKLTKCTYSMPAVDEEVRLC